MASRGVALVLAWALVACGRTRADPAGITVPWGSAGASGAADAVDANAACDWTGFSAPTVYNAEAAPDAMALGDVDGDGRMDIVVANWSGPYNLASTGSVSVFRAKNAGKFEPQATYATGIQPVAVTLGDFNGDGYPDLAVARLIDVDILVNAGDGTFLPSVPIKPDASALDLAVADFDADGHMDLALSEDNQTVTVMFGVGDGTFAAEVSSPTGRGEGDSLVVADVNGDDRVDLLVSNTAYPPGRGLPTAYGPGFVEVMLNLGGRGFAPAVTYEAGKGTNALSVADLDGDGALDIAAYNGQDRNFSLFFNAGDGTYGAPVTAFQNVNSVAAGHFNRDGQVDLVLSVDGLVDASDGIQLLSNLGGRNFDILPVYPTDTRPHVLRAADFDGDGVADLAALTKDGNLSVFLSECKPSTRP